jgi:uncharacterized membrane protein YuzA (DUF378 family)
MRLRETTRARAATHLEQADWLAIFLLITGGMLLGIEGLFQFDVLDALQLQVPEVAEGIKGLTGIAAFYAIGRLLLHRTGR